MCDKRAKKTYEKRQSFWSVVGVMSNGFYDPSSPFASMRLLMASLFTLFISFCLLKLETKIVFKQRLKTKSTVCVEIETMMMSMNNTNCKYFERIFFFFFWLRWMLITHFQTREKCQSADECTLKKQNLNVHKPYGFIITTFSSSVIFNFSRTTLINL